MPEDCLLSQKFQAFDMFLNDETLPIEYKPKHPKKGGTQGTKWKGPMSKKTKEPLKRVNHKGNIKFSNPRLLREAY